MKRGSSGGKKKPFRGQKDLIEDKTTDPLFTKEGSHYYFYHNDHLGTPQKLTAVNGAVVWSARYGSFGKAVIEVETVENNLRFPGQYFDSETGLHYNGYRCYDPSIGRYLRVDPIGLFGGLNLFIYSLQNPINRFDPSGLKCKIIYGDPYPGEEPLYQFERIEERGKWRAKLLWLAAVAAKKKAKVRIPVPPSWFTYIKHHMIFQVFVVYINYYEECCDDCTGECSEPEYIGRGKTGKEEELLRDVWDETVSLGE